jgi:hypothetical protein
MNDAATDTAPDREGWSVDARGYIHGGEGTPVFKMVKHAHNSAKTREKRKIKKSSTYELPVVNNPVGALSAAEIYRQTKNSIAASAN